MPLWAGLGTLIVATALFATVPAHAADEHYCDEPDADVNCIDPALEPGSALDAGEINPEVTAFDPNEPIDIADDGLFDGIYLCNVTDPGGGKAQAYASVNGHASGEMIFVLAGLDPNTDPYAGYGKGKFVDTTLTGTTHKGGAFSFEVAMGEDANGYAQATLNGKVHVKGRNLALEVIGYDVTVDCQSIW